MIKAEVVEKVLAAIKRPADYDYFFSRLSSADWIEPLQKAGRFREPPPPEQEGAYVTFPAWPESEYLVRVASAAPETVAKVILSISNTENVRVIDDFIAAVLLMPAPVSARLVDSAKLWAQLRYQLLFPEKLASLVSHLAQGDRVDEALGLARVLLAVLPDPKAQEKENDQFSFPPTARSRIDVWDYKLILKQHMPALVAADSLRTLHLLCDLLEDAVRLSRSSSEGDGPEDFSSIWRRNIDENSDDDVRDALVSAVRDAAKQIADQDVRQLSTVVETLEARPWFVFKRLALDLLRLFPEAGKELIAAQLTDESLFGIPGLWQEFFLLAQLAFADLSLGQQAVFLNWVQSGTSKELIQSEEKSKLWTYRHLAPIAEVLPANWKSRYQQLAEEFGPLEHPTSLTSPPRIYFGHPTPSTAQELAGKSFEELMEFLQEWEPRDFLSGTAEGLGESLSTLVGNEPDLFNGKLEQVRGLNPVYLRAVISGLSLAASQKKVIDWPGVLKLGMWVIEESNRQNERGVDREWVWAKGSVESLIEGRLKSDESSIPFEFRSLVWEIISLLVEDPNPTPEYEAVSSMDPPTLSLNTTRGLAMHVAMRYVLWVHRNTGDLGTRLLAAVPEVKAVLERHLDPEIDSAVAVRSVYGQWLPWLIKWDHEWSRVQLLRIFPTNREHRLLLDAAWGSYLAFNQPYGDVFDSLRDEYLRAVDRIGQSQNKDSLRDPDDRLAEHLMILYGRGYLSLEDQTGPLRHFFSNAPGDVRAHALWMVGHDFTEIKEDIPSEVLERMKALWSFRLDEAQAYESKSPYLAEVSAFGGWFASAKFDDEWSLQQLRDALRISGSAHPYHMVLERLAKLASRMPTITIECLRLLIEGDQKRKHLYSWHSQIRDVLKAALSSENQTAQEAAKSLINLLLARDRAYGSFRELLQSDH